MRNWISYASSSNWLRVVGVATIVLLGAYTMTQQSTRLSANDLPLQTAQTIKHELETGANPIAVVPTTKTDLRSDDTVFAIITDSSYKVLASSATIDNAPSVPPADTFTTTATNGSNWFTWQPASGVREAVEMLAYQSGSNKGFIVTGQSLKPFEDRINNFGWITLAAWVAVILWATFIPVPSFSKK